MSTESELNVSLEPHLEDTLKAVLPLLPSRYAPELKVVLEGVHSLKPAAASTKETPTEAACTVYTGPLIPYSLLSNVASWSRSDEGQKSLKGHNLSPAAYSMVALLAGTRTSPERKFPQASASISEDMSSGASDRRAVTSVLNALLSVLGSGIAVWWAAGRLQWRDEWKVLLALFAATVVAASEAVLYLIWDARRSKARTPGKRLPSTARRRIPARLTSGEYPALQGNEATDASLPAGDERLPVSMSQDSATTTVVQEHQTADNLRDRKKTKGPQDGVVGNA